MSMREGGGMPVVKSGRFDGALDAFIEANGKCEVTRARGLQAALKVIGIIGVK